MVERGDRREKRISDRLQVSLDETAREDLSLLLSKTGLSQRRLFNEAIKALAFMVEETLDGAEVSSIKAGRPPKQLSLRSIDRAERKRREKSA